MKFNKLLVGLCSMVVFTIPVYAAKKKLTETTEVTFMGSLKPGQTKSRSFDLIEGQNIIDLVSDDNDAVFSCKFNSDSGFTGLSQERVGNCSGKLNIKLPITVNLEFKNETDKNLDYKIRFQHTKKNK